MAESNVMELVARMDGQFDEFLGKFDKMKDQVDAKSKGLSLSFHKVAESLEAAGGKIKSIGGGFESAGSKLSSIGGSILKWGSIIGASVAAVGGGFAKVAMDAVESENLFDVSFGGMAGSARKWSEKLSADLGLNAYEVRKTAATFDVMLKSMGLSEAAALDMSEGITKLSYDMASFYNVKPEEAFEKLRAGLSGETEPLKQLGILVNDNTVKAYALKQGIKGTWETMDEGTKAALRYQVIMQATSAAQGDLKRTMDSPVNQLRLMKEQFTQIAIQIGTAIIPAILAFGEKLRAAIDGVGAWVKQNSDWLGQMAMTIAGSLGQAFTTVTGFIDRHKETIKSVVEEVVRLAATWGPVVLLLGAAGSVVGTLVSFFGGLISAFGALVAGSGVVLGALTTFATFVGGALMTVLGTILSPIGLLVAAVGGLAASFISFDGVKGALSGLWDSVKPTMDLLFGSVDKADKAWMKLHPDLTQALLAVRSALSGDFGPLKELLGQWADSFMEMWATVKDYISLGIIDFKLAMLPFTNYWDEISPYLKTIWDQLVVNIKDLWNSISKFFKDNSETIGNIFLAMWTTFKQLFEFQLGLVAGIFKGLVQTLSGDWAGAWNTIGNTFFKAWDRIKSMFSGSIKFVKDEWGKFTGWIEGHVPDFMKGFFGGSPAKSSKNYYGPAKSVEVTVPEASAVPAAPAAPQKDDWYSDYMTYVLGVPGYAAGTPSALPGWHWVGEQGPELMRLPAGAQIHSAAQSRQMAGAAGGGGSLSIDQVLINLPNVTDSAEAALHVKQTLLDMKRFGVNQGQVTAGAW